MGKVCAKRRKNQYHTLWGGTYLYGLYKRVPREGGLWTMSYGVTIYLKALWQYFQRVLYFLFSTSDSFKFCWISSLPTFECARVILQKTATQRPRKIGCLCIPQPPLETIINLSYVKLDIALTTNDRIYMNCLRHQTLAKLCHQKHYFRRHKFFQTSKLSVGTAYDVRRIQHQAKWGQSWILCL